MALVSQLFSSDPKLEACAVSDSAHIHRGAAGTHVGKIQQARINSVLQEIDAQMQIPIEELGIICINGNSFGGRAALECAAGF
jgi:hypothetical protein